MGKFKILWYYRSTLVFIILMGISLFLSGREKMNSSNFELSLRRVASLKSVEYTVRNYEGQISQEEMEKFKREYPIDPNAGMWRELQSIWGEKADGVKDTHWLTLPIDKAQGLLDKIVEFAQKHKGEYTDIVVIGMGGSSRPGDVIRGILGTKEGYARIHVMENLDEEDIQRVLSAIDISKTLFISISKSGTTAETMALTQIAYQKIKEAGLDPSRHFIAITTTSKTSSPLMQFLADNKVPQENIFEHPDLVGGRYTIFSVIGLLPAALAGHDVKAILASAKKAMESEAKYALGKFMAEMEKQGRIYMRVILPEELKAIGPWIEQLVAESQGKVDKEGKGRGILPIMERDYDASVYTSETFAFRIKLGDSDANDGFVRQVIEKGVPVWEFTVRSKEEAIGLLYALEFATGMSGIMMGIQPFDQPGVEAGKKATREMKEAMLSEIKERGISTQEAYEEELEKARTKYRVEVAPGVYLDYGAFMALLGENGESSLIAFGINKGIIKSASSTLSSLSPAELYSLLLLYSREVLGKSFGAVLPYAVETPERARVWETARSSLRQAGLQDLFGIGPLYEHSYRQYFMQGHDTGLFIFVVPTDPGTQTIPGEKIPEFTTGMQNALQALGTQKALSDVGRYTLRFEIEGPITPEKLTALALLFQQASP